MRHLPGRRETVGEHAVSSVARARTSDTVAAAIARLSQDRPDCAELLCVVDDRGHFAGALAVSKLFSAAQQTRVGAAMDATFPSVTAETDQEHAASLALHRQVNALPVVDRAGMLLGVMPPQALLQVLRREHVEDLHRLAGIERETHEARHAIDDPPLRRARHRLPWLLAGLAGAMLATAAMAGFESTLQANVVIAFFVPGLVYLADAIGTQSETIAVRGLSLTRTGIRRLLGAELRTGMTIGAALGLLAWAPTFAAFGDARLASAVATSIFLAGSLASVIGLLLPWLFVRFGKDPAYGSGPVATVIQDILTLLTYFATLQAFGV